MLALMRREGRLDTTTVIMLSEDADATRSRELGAAEHVTKPVNVAALAKQLGALLS
jgi:DNA-binding response OmpR family regulator